MFRDFLLDEGKSLMGDIIRVLALGLGRLWLSELVAEVNAFRYTLGVEGLVSEDDVKYALKVLEENGIVICENRFRSQLLGESVLDVLVSLTNYSSVLNELKSDLRYNEYIDKYKVRL
ncbi:MAG: hypothetical protein QXX09_05115 [Candidatus Methanomethylicia archaeon]